MKQLEIGGLYEDQFIVVNHVRENDDGSADVELQLGKDALRFLIELGFIAMLKEGMKHQAEELTE